VTPCSDVGYQRFGGPCYFHLQGEGDSAGKGDIIGVSVTLQLTVGQSVRVTLQLTVGKSVSQSVLASSPLEIHGQILAVVKTDAVLFVMGRSP